MHPCHSAWLNSHLFAVIHPPRDLRSAFRLRRLSRHRALGTLKCRFCGRCICARVCATITTHHARTNSVLGLSEEGLKIGLAANRVSLADRWSKEGLDELCGFPWDLKSKTGMKEGTHRLPLPSADRSRLPPPVQDLPDSRAFYVKKAAVEKHGYTAGCKGMRCSSSRSHRLHTQMLAGRGS